MNLFETGNEIDRDPVSLLFWQVCASLDAARVFVDEGAYIDALGRLNESTKATRRLRDAIQTLSNEVNK